MRRVVLELRTCQRCDGGFTVWASVCVTFCSQAGCAVKPCALLFPSWLR